jgi:hypothetical protein
MLIVLMRIWIVSLAIFLSVHTCYTSGYQVHPISTGVQLSPQESYLTSDATNMYTAETWNNKYSFYLLKAVGSTQLLSNALIDEIDRSSLYINIYAIAKGPANIMFYADCSNPSYQCSIYSLDLTNNNIVYLAISVYRAGYSSGFRLLYDLPTDTLYLTENSYSIVTRFSHISSGNVIIDYSYVPSLSQSRITLWNSTVVVAYTKIYRLGNWPLGTVNATLLASAPLGSTYYNTYAVTYNNIAADSTNLYFTVNDGCCAETPLYVYNLVTNTTPALFQTLSTYGGRDIYNVGNQIVVGDYSQAYETLQRNPTTVYASLLPANGLAVDSHSNLFAATDQAVLSVDKRGIAVVLADWGPYTCIAFNSYNNFVYVYSVQSNAIVEINPQDNSARSFITYSALGLSSAPTSLICDALGNLYVNDPGANNRIVKVSLSLSVQYASTGFITPVSLAICNNSLYVANAAIGPNSLYYITKYNLPAFTFNTRVGLPFKSPVNITCDSQYLYVAAADKRIYNSTFSMNKFSNYSVGSYNSFSAIIAPSGSSIGSLYAIDSNSYSSYNFYNISSGLIELPLYDGYLTYPQSSYSAATIDSAVGLGHSPNGTILIQRSSSGSTFRATIISPDGSLNTQFPLINSPSTSGQCNFPNYDSYDQLYFCSFSGEIWKFNLTDSGSMVRIRNSTVQPTLSKIDYMIFNPIDRTLIILSTTLKSVFILSANGLYLNSFSYSLLPSGYAGMIALDSSKNIYLTQLNATGGTLFQFQYSSNYKTNSTLIPFIPLLQSVSVDNNNVIWCTTTDGYLFRYNDNSRYYYPRLAATYNYVPYYLLRFDPYYNGVFVLIPQIYSTSQVYCSLFQVTNGGLPQTVDNMLSVLYQSSFAILNSKGLLAPKPASNGYSVYEYHNSSITGTAVFTSAYQPFNFVYDSTGLLWFIEGYSSGCIVYYNPVTKVKSATGICSTYSIAIDRWNGDLIWASSGSYIKSYSKASLTQTFSYTSSYTSKIIAIGPSGILYICLSGYTGVNPYYIQAFIVDRTGNYNPTLITTEFQNDPVIVGMVVDFQENIWIVDQNHDVSLLLANARRTKMLQTKSYTAITLDFFGNVYGYRIGAVVDALTAPKVLYEGRFDNFIVDASNNIYFAGNGNNGCLRKYSSSTKDVTNINCDIWGLNGLVIETANTILFADSFGRIRRVHLDTKASDIVIAAGIVWGTKQITIFQNTLYGIGTDGTNSWMWYTNNIQSRNVPQSGGDVAKGATTGLAVDSVGYLYYSSSTDNLIFKMDPTNTFIISTFVDTITGPTVLRYCSLLNSLYVLTTAGDVYSIDVSAASPIAVLYYSAANDGFNPSYYTDMAIYNNGTVLLKTTDYTFPIYYVTPITPQSSSSSTAALISKSSSSSGGISSSRRSSSSSSSSSSSRRSSSSSSRSSSSSSTSSTSSSSSSSRRPSSSSTSSSRGSSSSSSSSSGSSSSTDPLSSTFTPTSIINNGDSSTAIINNQPTTIVISSVTILLFNIADNLSLDEIQIELINDVYSMLQTLETSLQKSDIVILYIGSPYNYKSPNIQASADSVNSNKAVIADLSITFGFLTSNSAAEFINTYNNRSSNSPIYNTQLIQSSDPNNALAAQPVTYCTSSCNGNPNHNEINSNDWEMKPGTKLFIIVI